MIDKKVQDELDKVDKVISSLYNIIQSIYCKAKENGLDDDTIAFLIYKVECLQQVQIDLKDINIDFIKDFVPYTSERTRLLCSTMAERNHMEKDHNKIQEEIVQYFQEEQLAIDESMYARK